MALKATIYKVQLNVSDIDSGHYDDYNLTIAQHPSENERRMMYRLTVFALNAKEGPSFTKGLCAQEEPELWTHNAMGEIEHWIDLGTPDLKRIKQACGKSKKVSIYTYQERASIERFESIKSSIERFKNLSVTHLKVLGEVPLENLVTRNMDLYATIQDQELWLSDDQQRAGLSLVKAY